MEKPKQHCDCGSYDHQVPMPIKNRVRNIDLCIANLVAALNAANIETVASCCGHGKGFGDIILGDERGLVIYDDWRTMPHVKHMYPPETIEAMDNNEVTP